MTAPFGKVFGHDNFPPHEDYANEETGKAELYPARLQDEINESYTHDKVLPRVEGEDYVAEPEEAKEDAEGTQEQGNSITKPKYYGK